MGVMNCSRRGCEQIMCRHYIPQVGYICYECQSEFKIFVEREGRFLRTEHDISKQLEEFMEIEKDTYNDASPDMTIDEYFRKNSNE